MSIIIEDTKWFSGRECIGIVLVRLSETGQLKAYIGTADGNDESYDSQCIARSGSRFHLARQLWPQFPAESWAD